MTELEIRRARVAQMIAEGAVETDALRRKRKQAAKYQEQLESVAETILCGLQRGSKPKVAITTPRTQEQVSQGSVRRIAPNVKYDALASKANQILRELQAQ